MHSRLDQLGKLSCRGRVFIILNGGRIERTRFRGVPCARCDVEGENHVPCAAEGPGPVANSIVVGVLEHGAEDSVARNWSNGILDVDLVVQAAALARGVGCLTVNVSNPAAVGVPLIVRLPVPLVGSLSPGSFLGRR